jgi:hypothetical protein
MNKKVDIGPPPCLPGPGKTIAALSRRLARPSHTHSQPGLDDPSSPKRPRKEIKMCRVKFKACFYCHKLAIAHLTYCAPAARHLNVSESSEWRIFSTFSWSPFEGCDGLEIDSCINYPSLPGRQSACQNCTVRSVQILERAGRRWRGEDEMDANDEEEELIDERPIDEEEQALRADEALRNAQLHTRWGLSGMSGILDEQLPELFTRQTLNSPSTTAQSPQRWAGAADQEEDGQTHLGVLSPSDSDSDGDQENQPPPPFLDAMPRLPRLPRSVLEGMNEQPLRMRPVVTLYRTPGTLRPPSSQGMLEPIEEEELHLRTPTRREFRATESRILGSPSSPGLS